MKQIAGSLKEFRAKADENDKITDEISQTKADVSRLSQDQHASHSVNQSDTRSKTNNGSSILMSLHAEFADIRRRSSNVIVSGLKPVEGEDDCNLIPVLCEENLSIKPAVIREKCKQIGKEKPDKPRLYLVALRSEESAKDASLQVYRQLHPTKYFHQCRLDTSRGTICIGAESSSASASLNCRIQTTWTHSRSSSSGPPCTRCSILPLSWSCSISACLV